MFLLFITCFLIILGKLFYLQVLNPNIFTSDYIKTQKIAPKRGKIYDTNMQPLALNQATYVLFAEPHTIKDKEYVVHKIDEILHIGEATLEARIDDSKRWVRVAAGVTPEMRDKIKALNINGLGFDEETKRFYPEASLSAHILGFVGKNNNGEDIGYVGIEGFYEKDLTGLPGVLKSERDLLGRPIFVGTQDWVDAENGRDLVLTIDKTVQNIVKEKLKEGVINSEAKSGCAIAVDPMTMAILASSCLPDFDPEIYHTYTDNDIFKNQAIADLYEPGSTFKPLIMAAALEEGVLKPKDTYDEEGPVKIADAVVRNYNNEYSGKITMTHILEKSSNVGMIYVGEKLGKEKLYTYIDKYGFGSMTGIDLEGEASGYIKPIASWYPIDFATATFGQGVAITRLQLIRAFAAIINGGYLMKPYVVKEVVEGTNHYKREPQIVRRVLSEKTSAQMRDMLVSVVDYAKIDWDRPEGYKVGGKTGTAQIAVSGNYDPSKTIASFIGFAPAEKPKFLILVVMKEPGGHGFGSTAAAPVFFAITKELLSYYNVVPNH
jgi:cell division protein FtsI/penicillin-binding protein 2